MAWATRKSETHSPVGSSRSSTTEPAMRTLRSSGTATVLLLDLLLLAAVAVVALLAVVAVLLPRLVATMLSAVVVQLVATTICSLLT